MKLIQTHTDSVYREIQREWRCIGAMKVDYRIAHRLESFSRKILWVVFMLLVEVCRVLKSDLIVPIMNQLGFPIVS